MAKRDIPTVLGRLLYEVSWEGNARHYRDGGRGRENVLTAEALQLLDALPRQQFLGAVVDAMHGARTARASLLDEIEEATLEMLPEDICLRVSAGTWQEKCSVQPDGLIESESTFCLIEAKRLRSSSFQANQLARQLVAVVREAGDRIPCLILVTGAEPPFPVAGHGRLTIREAVDVYLEDVVGTEVEGLDRSADDLRQMLDDHVCWITWDELLRVVERQRRTFENESESVVRAIGRLVDKMKLVIEWHR